MKADAFRINSAKVSPEAWRPLYRRYAGGWPRVVKRYQRGMGEFDLLFTPSPLDTLCHAADGPHPKGTPRYRWVPIADGAQAGYLDAAAAEAE